MTRGSRGTTTACLTLTIALAAAVQLMPAAAAPQQASPQQPSFSVRVELVTTDVVARDAAGHFVSDLTGSDFDVYEDGVKQQVVSLTLSHGGRVTNVLAPAAPEAAEGIILPAAAARRTNDTTGRIFVFFIDDLHFQFD